MLLRCLPSARWTHGLHRIGGGRWRLRGSSLGLMSPDGTVEFNEPVDHDMKLEGLAADVLEEEGRLHC